MSGNENWCKIVNYYSKIHAYAVSISGRLKKTFSQELPKSNERGRGTRNNLCAGFLSKVTVIYVATSAN